MKTPWSRFVPHPEAGRAGEQPNLGKGARQLDWTLVDDQAARQALVLPQLRAARRSWLQMPPAVVMLGLPRSPR
jgi:hypothetical protein